VGFGIKNKKKNSTRKKKKSAFWGKRVLVGGEIGVFETGRKTKNQQKGGRLEETKKCQVLGGKGWGVKWE